MYSKILVPVDGSPTSNRGLDEAIKLARLTSAKLKLLHAVDLVSFAVAPEAGMAATPELLTLVREGAQYILDQARARVEASGLQAETMLVDTFAGRVCDLVADEAARWGADLIVIGTHGRRGVSRLVLGSDAEQIARLAPVPVLLVRGELAPPLSSAAP